MIVNGEKMSIKSNTVLGMLEELKLDSKKVVVEINMNIIPLEEFSNKTLMEDDRIEIIAFVGGG